MSFSVSYILAPPTSQLNYQAPEEAGGEITPVSDHCADGLSQLIIQYQNTGRLKSLICSYLDRVQAIEDDLNDLLTTALDVDSATGAALDNLGTLVGESRGGLGDDQYRKAVRTRILINRANGLISELIQIASVWYGTDLETVKVREYYPASVYFQVEGEPLTSDPVLLGQRIRDAAPAGVGFHFIWDQGAAQTFALSATHNTVENSDTTGLGSSHTSTGGQMAGMLI